MAHIVSCGTLLFVCWRRGREGSEQHEGVSVTRKLGGWWMPAATTANQHAEHSPWVFEAQQAQVQAAQHRQINVRQDGLVCGACQAAHDDAELRC